MFWISAALALAVVACGGQAPTLPTGSSGGGAAEPTSPPPQAQPAPPSSLGIDVSAIVACDLVSAQEAADLMGGTIYRELEQQPSPSCTYEVDPPGPDDYSTFIVSIEPTDWVEPFIENTPEDLGDPVPGIGDVAYLKYDETAENYDLMALVRGRFGLEIHGDDKDGTLALGALFMSRLVGP